MPDELQPTDEELLAGARLGEERAFRQIVERYEGRVAATIVGMLGPGADADDAGQETFIRFYKALDRFRGDSSVATYLTRIAINQSLKALKRRKSWHKRFFSRDDEEIRLDELYVDGHEAIDAIDHSTFVYGALQSLSPDHRAVTVLRLLDGYSTKETAAMLKVPEGTVMSRLSRSITKLNAILGPVLDPNQTINEVNQ